MKKLQSFALASLSLLVIATPAYTQESNLQDNGGGGYYQVPKGPLDDFLGRKPPILYKTKDGLIIDNYKEEKQTDGTVKVTMDIYNPLVIKGIVKVYDQKGNLVTDQTKFIDESRDAPENILDAGQRMIGDGFRAFGILSGLSGSIYDPRNNVEKQEFEITLRPGDTVQITNSDRLIIAYNIAASVFDLINAAEGLGRKSDESPEVQQFLRDFAEEWRKEGKLEVLKSDVNILALLSQGKSLLDIVDKESYAKLVTKMGEVILKSGIKSFDKTFKEKFSQGVDNILVSLGPVGAAVSKLSQVVYGTTKFANPLIRLYAAQQRLKLNYKPLTLTNSLTNQPTSASVPETQLRQNTSASRSQAQTNLMQNQLTAITNGGSSHIGSAAYFIGRSPMSDRVREEQFSGAKTPSIQQKSQYTDGVILQPPVDIVLTWNQNTQLDLDSHLTGPASADEKNPTRFHIYFDARGSLNGTPNALLYRDTIPDPAIGISRSEQARQGPEQTRINQLQLQKGVYRFYVNNFSSIQNNGKGTPTGNAAGPTGLSNSGAVVEIYQAGSAVPNFDPNNPTVQGVGTRFGDPIPVPQGQQGNVWQVFELDSRTGILRRVNQFGNVSQPALVPSVNPAESR